MRAPQERLKDILDAISFIERYAKRGPEAFKNDELIQSWCVRHLQIIGEAARALPQDVRDRMSEVPWSDIIGMRNILVHDYFDIDIDLTWEAIQRDLPKLKRTIQSYFKSY